MKLCALKMASVAGLLLLGVALTSRPAAAGHCGYYTCGPEVFVRSQPYAYHRYHDRAYGARSLYAPMYIYHGQDGALPGQSYWGGYAWRYLRPGY